LHLANSEHGAPAERACISPAPAPNPQVPTILLVEDEGFVREVTCEILGSAGYYVLLAQNAAEAITAFRGFPGEVQLLLTDLVLPDRDGCDLARELATLSVTVRAIFISGYPENCVTRKGLQRPGWFYLPKPFSAASLLQKIHDVLKQDVLKQDPV
jgi:two-component system, cell cycle sensor histidine kinase and response regulator CckA